MNAKRSSGRAAFVRRCIGFFKGGYQPAPIVGLCTLGAALLGTLALSEPKRYENVPPLFSTRGGKESDRSVNVAVKAVSLESADGIRTLTDHARQTYLIRERVAFNILIRSGYLRSAQMTYMDSNPPEINYSVEIARFDQEGGEGAAGLDAFACAYIEPRHEENNTAAPDGPRGAAAPSPDINEIDSINLRAAWVAMSLVAVEKFHRTAWHRKVEWAYADAYGSLFGRLPDISLGPAQIRPSLLRTLVAEQPALLREAGLASASDTDFRKVLLDECQSLRLAAVAMLYFMQRDSDTSQCEEQDGDCEMTAWVRSFSGQRRNTHAIVDYGPVVSRMVRFLANE